MQHYKLLPKIHPLKGLKQKKYSSIKHYLFKREYSSIIDQLLPVPLTLHTKISSMAVVLYSSCFINSPSGINTKSIELNHKIELKPQKEPLESSSSIITLSSPSPSLVFRMAACSGSSKERLHFQEPPPSVVANESVPTSRSHLVNIVDFSSTRDDNC